MAAEERKCYRKGGRRQLEPQWLREDALSGRSSKRAKQFGAFAALRGFEEMLAEAREQSYTENKNK